MLVKGQFIDGFLTRIETIGNRLPHPAMLFVYLCALVLLLSAVTSLVGVGAVHPVSGERVDAVNLLNTDGLHQILTNTVSNFTHFAPVGTVLVAIMGIGIAEHSGLIGAVLRASVSRAPDRLLTIIVVFAGVMSSLAADTGYVVLIPLAAMMFIAAGRHPLAGIAAAFAGVSGGYSANLLIGPLDVILAGLSTEAGRLVEPGIEVSAAGNYYFIIASTLLVTLVAAWVTEKWIEPRLAGSNYIDTSVEPSQNLSVQEVRALKWVALYSVIFILLILWGLLPQAGFLRNPDDGSVLRSPFIKGIVVIIALYAALAGIIYGRLSQNWRSSSEFINAMEKSMATMAGYLVLMFFAAQFVSYFGWSQLGIIAAIKGAGVLQSLQLPAPLLLLLFVLLAAAINLLVGSASAKWALIAPVFVPMLLLAGIAPEATQMAFRVGDSVTNIITPLMPYFGVVVAYAQTYDKDAGIGTIMATMIPYSFFLLIFWSLLLFIWVFFQLPLGPGVSAIIAV